MIKKSMKNERGLQGVFYLYDCTKTNSLGDEKEWWQLRLKDSHFVVSAVSSREHVEECLRIVCGRYRTHKRLMRALRDCENHMNTETQAKHQKEYEESGYKNDEAVEEIVALVSMETPKPIKRKSLIKKISLPEISEEDSEEVIKEIIEVLPIRMIKKKKIKVIPTI